MKLKIKMNNHNIKTKLVLASASEIRAKILRDANIEFRIEKTDTDEGQLKKEGLNRGDDLETIALTLATAKANAASTTKNEIVLGSDQLLEFKNHPYDKPVSMAEAKERLLEFSGHSHSLINASVLLKEGKQIWSHIERPKLTMRPLNPKEIDIYCDHAGEEILKSVGAYQLEKTGIRLFEKIEGDYFAILGLALHPLLSKLRALKVIDY